MVDSEEEAGSGEEEVEALSKRDSMCNLRDGDSSTKREAEVEGKNSTRQGAKSKCNSKTKDKARVGPPMCAVLYDK